MTETIVMDEIASIEFYQSPTNIKITLYCKDVDTTDNNVCEILCRRGSEPVVVFNKELEGDAFENYRHQLFYVYVLMQRVISTQFDDIRQGLEEYIEFAINTWDDDYE